MRSFKDFCEAKKLGKSKEAQRFAKGDGPTKIQIGNVSTGHKPHESGGGAHGDKRLKRMKTRKNRDEQAIKDQTN